MNYKILAGTLTGVLFLGSTLGVRLATYQTLDVKIETSERVCSGTSNGGVNCKYLVYTDKGVFENSDDFLSLKFNSSDLHGKLLKGGDYKISTIGFRFGFLSMYPNILKVE